MPALHLQEECNDGGLHRDVQGRDRLIGDDEGRLADEGPGNGYALFLATGEVLRSARGQHAG